MRINYWTTSSLEPEIEAVAKELFDIVGEFDRSLIVSINNQFKIEYSATNKSLGVNPKFDPIMRLLIPVIESFGNINHIYAEILPWTFLKALHRRPTILTIASEKGCIDREILDLCDIVVAQTPHMQSQLEKSGLNRDRIELIYPGVDCEIFCSRSHLIGRKTPLRILFATFPRLPEELAPRGVWRLLDLAEYCSDIEFVFLGRPWKNAKGAEEVVKSEIVSRKLTNVEFISGIQTNMPAVYRSCDFTIIPYETASGGKECPLSLVESMACGVPILISQEAPFSAFVTEHGCGSVFGGSKSEFANVVEKARASHKILSESAVSTARRFFDRNKTIRKYRSLYERLHSIS